MTSQVEDRSVPIKLSGREALSLTSFERGEGMRGTPRGTSTRKSSKSDGLNRSYVHAIRRVTTIEMDFGDFTFNHPLKAERCREYRRLDGQSEAL